MVTILSPEKTDLIEKCEFCYTADETRGKILNKRKVHNQEVTSWSLEGPVQLPDMFCLVHTCASMNFKPTLKTGKSDIKHFFNLKKIS